MTLNDLPVCIYCDEPVLEGERRAPMMQPAHYACGLRQAVGSVGHQKGRCFCYGGDEEDPPGMTRREAAEAALAYFLNHLTERPPT